MSIRCEDEKLSKEVEDYSHKPCPCCGSCFPPQASKDEEGCYLLCECGLGFGPSKDIHDLVRRWNTRPLEDRITKIVEMISIHLGMLTDFDQPKLPSVRRY